MAILYRSGPYRWGELSSLLLSQIEQSTDGAAGLAPQIGNKTACHNKTTGQSYYCRWGRAKQKGREGLIVE